MLKPALPPEVPQLGQPLPGDLGGPMLKAEQQAQGLYGPHGADPAEAERLARLKEAEEAAASPVMFRSSRDAVQGNSTAPQANAASGDQNRQDQKEAFLAHRSAADTR